MGVAERGSQLAPTWLGVKFSLTLNRLFASLIIIVMIMIMLMVMSADEAT